MPERPWDGHFAHNVIEVMGTKGTSLEPIIRQQREQGNKTDKFQVVRINSNHTKIIRTDWRGKAKKVGDI